MSDNEPVRIAWKRIEPLDQEQIPTNGMFSSLNALRQEWEQYLGALPEKDRARIRQRTLRKLAVETGIIERLYDIDWGLTLTLVAEGFTREVVERAGGRIEETTLATLRAQRDSLEMVLDFVHRERRLTDSFIKELHAALTRTQKSYDVVDALGRPTRHALDHGVWKRYPNHVERSDGSILEYTPPEHVQSEIDRLLMEFESLEDMHSVHPIAVAAWLHHRFVQIHPFADGNGRVARALTLLVLERHHYAPLVVDRYHRKDYIGALNEANDGNLRSLIKLFARLESSALVGELERPEEDLSEVSSDIARTLADQIAGIRHRRRSEMQAALRARALIVRPRINHWLNAKRDELRQLFDERSITDAVVTVLHVDHEDERTGWFRKQRMESAITSGHFADFNTYSAWSRLRIRVEGLQVQYIVSMHGAGRESDVVAVTTGGDIRIIGGMAIDSEDEAHGAFGEWEYILTTSNSFAFVHSEAPEELQERMDDLHELLDSSFNVVIAHLLRTLQGIRSSNGP